MPGYFFVSSDNGAEFVVNGKTFKAKFMAALEQNSTLARLKITAYKQTGATYSLTSDDHAQIADDYEGSDAGFHWATTSQDVTVILKAEGTAKSGDEDRPCLLVVTVLNDQIEGVLGDELRFEYPE